MNLVISQKSDKPIYSQIYEQIASQIMKGELSAGEKLPPIRTVALNLRISVIPVKQAWDQLEREGFISTFTGRGTFVSEFENHEIKSMQISSAENMLLKNVASCRDMGLSLDEIIDIVRRGFEG